MGTLLFFCTLLAGLAVIYGILAYVREHVQKPQELKNALALQVKANQKIARDFKESLVQYAERNNAYDQPFAQNVTFNSYIALLDQTLSSALSNASLNKALKRKTSPKALRSISAGLDEQCTNLLKAKIYFELNFLHADIGVDDTAG